MANSFAKSLLLPLFHDLRDLADRRYSSCSIGTARDLPGDTPLGIETAAQMMEKLVRSLYDLDGFFRVFEDLGGFNCRTIKQALEACRGRPGPFLAFLSFSVFRLRFGFANRPLRPLGYATVSRPSSLQTAVISANGLYDPYPPGSRSQVGIPAHHGRRMAHDLHDNTIGDLGGNHSRRGAGRSRRPPRSGAISENARSSAAAARGLPGILGADPPPVGRLLNKLWHFATIPSSYSQIAKI